MDGIVNPLRAYFNLVTLFGPSGQSMIPQTRIELVGGPNDGQLHPYQGQEVLFTTDNVVAYYNPKETMQDSVTITRYTYKVRVYRPNFMAALTRKAVYINE